MRLSDARIGYAGYSRDFSVPGDRRRFGAYMRMKGLATEPARLSREYDVVLVTHNGDIPGWTKRKRRAGDEFRFIFELADSYFTQTGLPRRLLKGAGRYAIGMDSRMSPDFLRTLVNACESADAVICSTEEQRAEILRYNPNVFVSFDYFGDDLGPPKRDYRRGGRLRLVWEGQSTTLGNIQSIRGLLNRFKDDIELHVVTDPLIHRYFGRFGSYDSRDALRGIECPIRFHRWQLESFSAHISSADVAIIPIDLSNAMARGKPENKLVMMWQLGMPALTSETPAYRRAMNGAGIQMCCASEEEWAARLQALIAANGGKLEEIGRHCRAYADTAYSKSEFMRRFDLAFEAVGLATD